MPCSATDRAYLLGCGLLVAAGFLLVTAGRLIARSLAS